MTKATNGTRQLSASAFVHIANNRVTMLVDTAERPEDIDEVRAREAYERALEQLQQKQSIQEYHVSQASLAKGNAPPEKGHKKDRRLAKWHRFCSGAILSNDDRFLAIGCQKELLVRSCTHLYLRKRAITHGIFPTSSRQVQA